MRWLGLCVLMTAAGCQFDQSGGAAAVAADADPNAPDADPNAPDADPNAPDADPLCGFPFEPSQFDACADPVASTGFLDINGSAFVYDTDTQAFTPPVGAGEFERSDLGNVHVIWTERFRVHGSSSLRVVGSKPLMVVATKDINIEGPLDVSSTYDGVTFEVGAGASELRTACANPPALGVMCDNHGASGGGGGGFAGIGGQGDHGAAARDCGDGDLGKPPTAGGLVVALPVTMRAGCAGAAGSTTNDGGTGGPGLGGPGGGAIHLVAGGDLSIDSVINAGGAAGGPATGDVRASAGGAGSGGYIGLESITIELLSGAVLAANGGGGGGGSDNASGTVGENAHADANPALGGAPDSAGSRGNNGGAAAIAPEAPEAPGVPLPQTEADRGGGGGGGSVGYILVYRHGGMFTADPAAVQTPAPLQQ